MCDPASGQGEGPLLLRTVEALWYMVDDCESFPLVFLLLLHSVDVAVSMLTCGLWVLASGCQRIMDMNGHQLLCRLARKFGQENPDAAGAIFRLLADTLWQASHDLSFLVARGVAVSFAVSEAEETLYSEPRPRPVQLCGRLKSDVPRLLVWRSSQVWGAELDAHLLASVIKWAVQEAGCSVALRPSYCRFACGSTCVDSV